MRVVVADDHALFRRGISSLLENLFDAEVVEAMSLADAVARARTLPSIDLLLMDLHMPGVESADSIVALAGAFPSAKIAIMSASENRMDVASALAAGIDGYIPKSLGVDEIEAALHEILGGHTYVPMSATRREILAHGVSETLPLDQLTERQRHVLDELVKGRASKEIARTLDIAEGTVKIHLAAIYRLLEVKTRAEAIAKVRLVMGPVAA
ncbi:MAG: response regulator transcription factor [Pseudomonadota bacterium]